MWVENIQNFNKWIFIILAILYSYCEYRVYNIRLIIPTVYRHYKITFITFITIKPFFFISPKSSSVFNIYSRKHKQLYKYIISLLNSQKYVNPSNSHTHSANSTQISQNPGSIQRLDSISTSSAVNPSPKIPSAGDGQSGNSAKNSKNKAKTGKVDLLNFSDRTLSSKLYSIKRKEIWLFEKGAMSRK